jgi:cytochrome c-type biogenesis protein
MAVGLSPVLAFAAGALTILSPCVLPLVPIVLAGAGQKDRFGPLALAIGLVLSFTTVGFLVAAMGPAWGIDGDIVRFFGSFLLIAAGLVLLVKPVEAVIARVTGPLANWASARQSGLESHGLAGQAAIGVLLGLVWSPCVGPTLGAATVLAAQGQDLAQVAFVMASFGVGIACVLLVIALASRTLMSRWRGSMMSAGGRGKRILGGLLILVGIMIVTGIDRTVEGVLVAASPDWLVDLTTAF